MIKQKFLYKKDKHYMVQQKYLFKEFNKNYTLSKNVVVVNVIGTNGKGSVSNYLSYNLQRIYKKVGFFTSPHIFSKNERIQINNKPIDKKILKEKLKKIKKYNFIDFHNYFYIAMQYFIEQNCDAIVLEAAVGGRDDITAYFTNKYVILTSVSHDHLEVLGDTKEEILTNKCLIVEGKKNITFYTGTNLKKLNTLASKIFKKTKTKHIIVDNDSNNYQKQNQLLVSKFLKNEFNIDDPVFFEIFGRTTVFNIEKIINNKKKTIKMVIDVGHNKNGLEYSLKLIKEKKINIKNVVLCINKKKYIFDIKKLFKGYNLYVFNLNEEYISSKMIKGSFEVKNIKEYIEKMTKNTLFIGSFYFISKIIDKEYFYKNLKENELLLKKVIEKDLKNKTYK